MSLFSPREFTYIHTDDWKERALKLQTDLASGPFAEAIWDRFGIKSDTDLKYLSDKIKIALFGTAKDLTKEQSELITYIKDKCIDKSCYNNAVYLAVVYVSILHHHESEYIFPIFRILSKEKNDPEFCSIIDHLGRVYNDLSAYKENNTWDLSTLMLPTKGVYKLIDDKCDVVIWNQDDRGLLKDVADSTAATIGIGSTVGMVAGAGLSLFPLTAPVGIAVLSTSGLFGAVSGTYGAGRAVNTLMDRKEHELPISFFDRDARGCWISIAASSASALSLGASELIAPKLIRAAEMGEECSLLLSTTYTTISVASLSVNTIGFCNLVYDTARKDKITKEDILNLVTSTFFFCHSVISFQTASGVIKKAQSMELAKIKESLSPEQQEIFDCLREAHMESVKPGKINELKGNQNYLRELKKIDNLDQFFQQFTLTPDNNLNINGELTIHQRAFVQIPEQERAKILEGLRKLKNNEISLDEFKTRAAETQKNYLLTLDRERVDFKKYVTEAFGENLDRVEVAGKNIFENLKPHEIDRLHQVTKHSLNNDPDYVQLGKEFASEMKVKNTTEFCASSEYAVRKVQREIAIRAKENPNPPRDRGVKVKDFYKKQIIEEYRRNNYENLKTSFDHLKSECDVVNSAMHNRFGNSFAAANHYDKHQVLPSVDPKNALTPSQYFEIASDMVSDVFCEMEWSQDGSSLKCTFKAGNLMAIKFQNVSNGESVIATLMESKNNKIIAQKYCYFPTASNHVIYTDFGMDDILPDFSSI